MRELRCPGNRVFGLLDEDEGDKPSGVLEVKCGSVFCGKRPGVVVLHRFDLGTGEIRTRTFLEPDHRRQKGE